MKKSMIVVGQYYKARVSGRITTVRVDSIRVVSAGPGNGWYSPRDRTLYDVTNTTTGRKTTFRSCQKFIEPTLDPSQKFRSASPSPNHQNTPMPSLNSKLAEKISQQPSVSNKTPHLIIEALAGTGKTTTLVEGLRTMFGHTSSIVPSPQQQAIWESLNLSRGTESVCFVAFNKSIAMELQRRVPQPAVAMTMHSMGLKAVTAAFGRVTVSEYRVGSLLAEIMGKDIKDLKHKDFELLRNVEKLVGLCKVNLANMDIVYQNGDDEGYKQQWADVLDDLCSYFDLELNGTRARVYDLVPKVLERCKDVDKDRQIDYNDMIWLPVVLNLGMVKYDVLLVDEAQDLNRCQQALAKRASRRLILCGDPHQAIYGFAGADSESMARMQRELEGTVEGCQVLPLTVTRRCGKAIVKEAQALVPAFEAHESNPEGLISQAIYKGEQGSYIPLVQDGDMLLCRVNAPLVSQCFKFLKLGRKANIQGRDIGAGLVSTIKKCMKSCGENFGQEKVVELISRLDHWLQVETEKEQAKKFPKESKLINLQDRFDCLMCFAENAETVQQVINKIESIFTDTRDLRGINLSTIHKAKGLEANRVFLLQPEGASVPHPMAKTVWQREQEWNLKYVAITRAIEELVFVY